MALLLRIPSVCQACDGQGSVSLATTLLADAVALNWSCRSCREEWPVTTADQIERRRNAPERRKRPRSDRRKP